MEGERIGGTSAAADIPLVKGGIEMDELFSRKEPVMKYSFVAAKCLVRAAVVTAVVAIAASMVHAQPQPPCQPLPEDRTITWCFPIDNSTLVSSTVVEWGWIKDSLPHTAKEYVDGKYMNSPPDIFNGGAYFGFDDKIHTYTIIVTDSMGTFEKSISFRQSLTPPCSIPTGDPSINFCIPKNGEVTTSPLRYAAVARASAGVTYLQLWVDGVQEGTEHIAGTATMKMLNNYIYLANGTHRVVMVAKLADGTTLKKSVAVQIVSAP